MLSRQHPSLNFALYANNFASNSGNWSAKIWTANSPAFLAPPEPIAIVPTGMPGGIWTVA